MKAWEGMERRHGGDIYPAIKTGTNRLKAHEKRTKLLIKTNVSRELFLCFSFSIFCSHSKAFNFNLIMNILSTGMLQG
jgi:hypothetical protein